MIQSEGVRESLLEEVTLKLIYIYIYKDCHLMVTSRGRGGVGGSIE